MSPHITSEYEKDTSSPPPDRKVNTDGNVSAIVPLSLTVFFRPLLTDTESALPFSPMMLRLTSSMLSVRVLIRRIIAKTDEFDTYRQATENRNARICARANAVIKKLKNFQI